ncbi:MAG: hypothetical protein ACK5Q6_15945, partial [Cyanobacteriota bacterium]
MRWDCRSVSAVDCTGGSGSCGGGSAAFSRGKGAGATGGKAGTAELQALEQRLVRGELLVLLIAQQVGVAPEA